MNDSTTLGSCTEAAKPSRWRKWFSLIVSAAILAAMILFLREHSEDLTSFRAADLSLLVLALGMSVLRLCVTAMISRTVANSVGGSVSFAVCIAASSVASAANLLLPAHSGVVVRAYYICRRGGCSWRPFLSGLMGVQFVHAIVTSGLACLFLLLLESGTDRNAALALSASALVACGVVVAVVRSLGQREWMGLRLRQLVEGWLCLAGRARTVSIISLLCVAARLLESACYWVVARSLGIDVSYFAVVGITSVGSIAALSGLTPGGFGLYEGAICAVSHSAGVNPAQALMVALTCRAVHALRSAVLAPIGIWSLGHPSGTSGGARSVNQDFVVDA